MKTKALPLLLYCFCVLFSTSGHGADLIERTAVQNIKKTLQLIVDSEAGSQQLSDATKILREQFANLQKEPQIQTGGIYRSFFHSLPIRQYSREETDGINQSLFRALPKIITLLKGQGESADSDAYMLLISVQADCPAPETEVWTKWLASKNSHRDVLWSWALTLSIRP